MRILVSLFLLLILAGVVGGGAYLAFVDTEAPRQSVEIVIPNDRFED